MDNKGHVIEYDGHVEKVNDDGTFNVKFSFAVTRDSAGLELDENEKKTTLKKKVTENFSVGKTFSGERTYCDRNLPKHQVRPKHPHDLSDGVLIHLLRQDVQAIRRRLHMRGVTGLFVGWWGPRILDRLGCRPLKASPGDKKLHKLWEADSESEPSDGMSDWEEWADVDEGTGEPSQETKNGRKDGRGVARERDKHEGARTG